MKAANRVVKLVLVVGFALATLAQGQGETYQVFQTPAEYAAATGDTLTIAGEAPSLAEQVAAGELPPVTERVGQEPMVLEPLDEIGRYGGILRAPATGPDTEGWELATASDQTLFSLTPDLTIIPSIVRDSEFNEDNTSLRLFLREGMKWSDGEPFTADDFVFWYEDILLNEALTPTVPQIYLAGGEPLKLTKVGDYEVVLDFASPNPTITATLATPFAYLAPFAPAHYLKQFHLDYNENAEADAQAGGYTDWADMFTSRSTRNSLGQEQENMELPVLNPWVWVGIDNAGNRFFERNPYYWKVDTAGNQLPYIDEAHRLLIQNVDTKKLAVLGGDVDFASKDLALTDFPLYKQGEADGNYTAFLGDGSKGSFLVFGFNETWEGDPALLDIYSDVRFRQALSLALNRDEINEVVFLGQGVPRQVAPIPGTSYHEDWMENYYAEYDVEGANALLDEMGLEWDANEEFRLRPDGETLAIPLEYWRWGDDVAKIVELVTEYWADIGVKIDSKELEPSLFFTRRTSNELPIVTWGGDNQTELRLYTDSEWSRPPYQVGIMYPWETWFEEDGAEGTEPPEEIKELWDWNEQRLQTLIGSEEYLELSRQIATYNVENLSQIGTVGLVPYPVVFSNRLGNTPRSGIFTTDAIFFRPYAADTWFFK